MNIKKILNELITELNKLPEKEKIEELNQIKKALHEISPFCNEPVDCVLWINGDIVEANDYNPNKVAPPEMKLLEHSIREDGYTQPIVAYKTNKKDTYEVVDGFHRNRVGKEATDIKEKIKGYLPITIIKEDRGDKKDRMASTVRHNRARGTHGISNMAELVTALYFDGWSKKRIAEELGMDKDEVLRLQQFTGLGTLFKDRDFSKSWEL